MYGLQLQDLSMFLGIRPVGLGTMTVWEALQDSVHDNEQTSSLLSSLTRSVSGLSTQISSFRSPDTFFSDPTFQRTLSDTVHNLATKAMLPIRQSLLDFVALFWKFTSQPGPIRISPPQARASGTSGQSSWCCLGGNRCWTTAYRGRFGTSARGYME
jgi:hypothetical protein